MGSATGTPQPRHPDSTSLPATGFGTGTGRRVARIAGVLAWYLACYWTVTRVTAARGPGVLVQTEIALDRLVPHLPGTWPLYWIAYPFVILGGGAALLRMPDPAFRRALVALLAMTSVGALVQLLFPARAPWPAFPAPMQVRFHQSGLILPYATLPSMHVAYCLFAAALVSAVRPGSVARLVTLLLVPLVALATLTLKEHVVLDAITGLALGAVSAWWWRRGPA
jgi:hypothetical protein